MRKLLLIVVLAACSQSNPSTSVAELDVNTYTQYVHPIIEARCGTLDCHGDPARPMRIYAQTGLRLTDALRATKELTPDELAANVRAMAAVDPGAPPASSLILTKPLAGLVDHAGGVLWPNATDPQPVCVESFLAGTIDVAACTTADQQTQLPPPP